MKYVLNDCKHCFKELKRLEKETKLMAKPVVLRVWVTKEEWKTKHFCIETFKNSKQIHDAEAERARTIKILEDINYSFEGNRIGDVKRYVSEWLEDLR